MPIRNALALAKSAVSALAFFVFLMRASTGRTQKDGRISKRGCSSFSYNKCVSGIGLLFQIEFIGVYKNLYLFFFRTLAFMTSY